MKNIAFDNAELELIKMSLRHCMESCKEGGKSGGCKDCEKVEALLNKLSY